METKNTFNINDLMAERESAIPMSTECHDCPINLMFISVFGVSMSTIVHECLPLSTLSVGKEVGKADGGT